MSMLFITNRAPKSGMKTVIGRTFEFDLKNNAPGNSVYFCERDDFGKCTEIGGMQLMSKIKNAKTRQILIYIHGYSNLPEDVFRSAGEFQDLCNASKKSEVLVVPLIWPCDNDIGIVKDYWDDEKAADASAMSFARVLQKFMEWRDSAKYNPENDPCMKRINVLAHSMGNRVFRQTLVAWNQYDLAAGVPLIFRNTFLVAADVVNETLHKGELGELICHASRNVVVYYASDDLAMRASKIANVKERVASRRLGHTGPENIDLCLGNVYAADCDDVNNIYDNPKGHSYFRSGCTKGKAGVVFEHVMGCILSGRVHIDDPTCRRIILKDK